jgi:hypothetical protein
MIVSGGMRSNRGPCSRALPLLCSSRREKSGRLTEVVSRRTRIDFHQQTERSKLAGPGRLVHPVGFEPTRSRFSADCVYPIAPQVRMPGLPPEARRLSSFAHPWAGATEDTLRRAFAAHRRAKGGAR